MSRPLSVLLVAVFLGMLATPVCAQSQTAAAPSKVQSPKVTAQEFRKKETTAEFAKVVAQVDEFSKKHGVENVLLVVDLDNTLLAMNQDLGSDQWFIWQEDLQDQDPCHPDLVAPKFDGLLQAQGVLFALSAMHPPQPELPDMVGGLIQRKVPTVILTSRGKEFRNSAARELKRNEYDISSSTLEVVEKRGTFKPYRAEHPNKHGLNAETIKEIGAAKDVTYADGIYMTAGQHKGYMLKTLLARLSNASADKPFGNFKAIVFVDDRAKHTDRMHAAFAGDPVDLATFRYSREDGNVERFKSSTKHHVIRDWDLLNGFTKTVLVK